MCSVRHNYSVSSFEELLNRFDFFFFEFRIPICLEVASNQAALVLGEREIDTMKIH